MAEPHASTFQAALDHRPLKAFQLVLVGLLLLVLVIDGIDIQLLSLVAPVIIAEWGVQRAAFGPALAGALIGMSLGAFFGGWLGDRLGRMPVLLFSVTSFGLATMAAGLTDSVMAMTALRIASGIGFGAAAPNAIALASEWLPERAKSQVTSLLSIGTPAGGMIGATLVLGLLPVWGWRVTFYACGALTIALAFLLLGMGRESPAFLAAKGRVAIARALAWQKLGLDWTPPANVPPSAPEQTRAPAQGILARSSARLNIGAGLGFFSIAFVSYALVAWTTVMLTGFGMGMNDAVSALFSFNLAAVAAAVLAGMVMNRLGSRSVLAGSSLLLLGSVALLGMVLSQLRVAVGSPLLVCVLVGAAGGFAGAAMASIYAMMAAGYAIAVRGAGLGLGMMLGRAGGIAASLTGGQLLDAGQGSPWVFAGALMLAACAGAVCAFVSDRHLEPRRKVAARGGNLAN